VIHTCAHITVARPSPVNDADPRDVAAVLRLAAPRLTNELLFHNVVTKVLEAGVWAAVEMPCFDRAERLILRLGYLGLVLPPSGVFRKLTMLDLAYVQFPDARDIGDAFSSARCPSLQQLRLVDTGVSNLAIFSVFPKLVVGNCQRVAAAHCCVTDADRTAYCSLLRQATSG
jgi:hypothetical protein